jgi:Fe-S cluster assembly protein SufD
MEAWRHTNIAPILAGRFVRSGVAPEVSGGGEGVWTGRLHEAPDEILALARRHFGSLADLEGHPFTALNGSLLGEVTLIVLPRGCSAGEPVTIRHTAGPGSSLNTPRTLILAGDGAAGSITESYEGQGPEGGYLTTAVTEIHCGEDTDLKYYRIQRESPGSFHIGRMQARVGARGKLHTSGITLGAALDRADAGVSLAGESATCEMDGLFVTDGLRHVDNRTRIEHAVPNCRSRQVYKGILSDRSTAVFVGRVVVQPGAQQTDADQSNPNLLLSDDATIFTRPQLEIYADDVRCTHGATVGQLDPDSLFYLRTRGIDPDEAGRLLVKGFAGEILDRLEIPALRTQLESEVAGRLPAASGTEG